MLRASPSVQALVLAPIPADTIVELLGETQGQSLGASALWYRVRWGDQIGFVFSGLVEVSS